jgi:membrane protein implicated in regulation of membrane protease activity
MLETVFLIAAVIGGTVLVCQFALTLLGMGHDVGDSAGDFHGDMQGDFHGDFHGDVHAGGHSGDFVVDDGSLAGDHHTPLGTAASGEFHHADSSWLFGVISFRTLVAAAAFFGVAGLTAQSAGFSSTASLALALAAGLAAMYGMYWLLHGISRLASSGNERIANAVGRRATVYIPIPAEGRGAGKVQLSMQNRIVEFQATTDEPERLRTGEAVEVVAVAGSDTVRVRRAAQAVEA